MTTFQLTGSAMPAYGVPAFGGSRNVDDNGTASGGNGTAGGGPVPVYGAAP